MENIDSKNKTMFWKVLIQMLTRFPLEALNLIFTAPFTPTFWGPNYTFFGKIKTNSVYKLHNPRAG